MLPHTTLGTTVRTSISTNLIPLMQFSTVAAIAVGTIFSTTAPVQAAALTLGRLTFSEAGGDYQITGGRIDNDFYTIEQAVYGPNINLLMAIDGLRRSRSIGFQFQSILTNLTGTPWIFFDHELREDVNTPSPEGDGLSFAQGFTSLRPFTSNLFGNADEVTDVRDFINFSGGIVNPGQTVTFQYAITDNSPIDRFFLLQRPNFQTGGVGFVDLTPPPPPEPPAPPPEPPAPPPEPPAPPPEPAPQPAPPAPEPVPQPAPPAPEPVPAPPAPQPVPPAPIPSPSPAPTTEVIVPIASPSPETNSAAVPEPSTVLGLLTFGAIAGRLRAKQKR
jgi:hypothetical protein